MRLRWLVLAASLSACAHSVLVHPDDDTYRRAIDHFRNVRTLVAASLAPDDEQLMFLQAEALFRYRFVIPNHSVGSELAVRLTAAGHDVAMVDKNVRAFRRLPADFAGQTVRGFGFDRDDHSMRSVGEDAAGVGRLVGGGHVEQRLHARGQQFLTDVRRQRDLGEYMLNHPERP